MILLCLVISFVFSKVSVAKIWWLSFAFFFFLQCVYPLGVTDSANLIVTRKASEVNSFLNLKRRRKKKSKPRETEVNCNLSLTSPCL